MSSPNIPKEVLEDFRSDIQKLSWQEFQTWSFRDRSQVLTWMINDFEGFMTDLERDALRNDYLTTEDNAIRQQMLYEHYQRALKNRSKA